MKQHETIEGKTLKKTLSLSFDLSVHCFDIVFILTVDEFNGSDFLNYMDRTDVLIDCYVCIVKSSYMICYN
jgi:hypothetical protein